MQCNSKTDCPDCKLNYLTMKKGIDHTKAMVTAYKKYIMFWS